MFDLILAGMKSFPGSEELQLHGCQALHVLLDAGVCGTHLLQHGPACNHTVLSSLTSKLEAARYITSKLLCHCE